MKKKILNLTTWVATILTALMWFPIIVYGILEYLPFFKGDAGISIGIIGGADGPTSIFVSTTALIASIWDWILLGGLLILTIALWILKLKGKNK